MRSHPLLILALLALPLAGCLGADDAPVEAASTGSSTASAPADPTPNPAAPQPASPASSEPASSTQAASDANETQAAAPAAPVTKEFLWNGKMDTGACIPLGPGVCQYRTIEWGDSFKFYDEADPVGASLTLTWTSRGPHDESLRILLLAVEGDSRSWSGTVFASAEGPSPVTVDAPAFALEPGQFLVVGVVAPSATPQPVYARVETGTAFQVEGQLLVAG